MNTFIYGSCVSRDIFTVADKNEYVKQYIARQSVASAVADPYPLALDDIDTPSKFQQRMLYFDCNKLLFQELSQTDFDCLLIDFIDERFGLWEGQGTCITGSSEAAGAGLDKKHGFAPIPLTEKNKRWYPACEELAKRLLPLAKEKKILLHEAYWAKRYIENGKTYRFPSEMLGSIKANNKMLSRYYRAFKRSMGKGLRALPKSTPISDAGHHWGLSPVHYTSAYYLEMFKAIEAICEDRKPI